MGRNTGQILTDSPFCVPQLLNDKQQKVRESEPVHRGSEGGTMHIGYLFHQATDKQGHKRKTGTWGQRHMAIKSAPLTSSLIVHLCLLGWQPHGCLSIIQDPVCTHGQSCSSHFLTWSQVHLSVNEAGFVRSCNVFYQNGSYTGEGVRGREGRVRRACVPERFIVILIVTGLTLLLTAAFLPGFFTCHDYLSCYFNDSLLSLCRPRAAFPAKKVQTFTISKAKVLSLQMLLSN